MTRRRSLSDEERALWTGFARSIKPIHRTRKQSAESAEAIEVGNRSVTASTPRAVPRRVAAEPALPEKIAATGAARPAAEKTSGSRPRADRGSARSARLHANPGTRRIVALSAPRPVRRRKDRARGHRQRGGQRSRLARRRTERGVLKRQVPIWFHCPNFGPSSSALRTLILAMAGRAHFMSGYGARAKALLTLTIGISQQKQKTATEICEHRSLVGVTAPCPIPPIPSQSPPTRGDDRRQTSFCSSREVDGDHPRNQSRAAGSDISPRLTPANTISYRINRLRSAFLARSPTCFCT